jgi:hypothetical protein
LFSLPGFFYLFPAISSRNALASFAPPQEWKLSAILTAFSL